MLLIGFLFFWGVYNIVLALNSLVCTTRPGTVSIGIKKFTPPPETQSEDPDGGWLIRKGILRDGWKVGSRLRGIEKHATLEKFSEISR